MSEASRQAHWEGVYTSSDEIGVSWFQDNPAPSLELIERAGADKDTGKDTRRDPGIIDIGGGASNAASVT
jgi:hypothetical protein